MPPFKQLAALPRLRTLWVSAGRRGARCPDSVAELAASATLEELGLHRFSWVPRPTAATGDAEGGAEGGDGGGAGGGAGGGGNGGGNGGGVDVALLTQLLEAQLAAQGVAPDAVAGALAGGAVEALGEDLAMHGLEVGGGGGGNGIAIAMG